MFNRLPKMLIKKAKSYFAWFKQFIVSFFLQTYFGRLRIVTSIVVLAFGFLFVQVILVFSTRDSKNTNINKSLPQTSYFPKYSRPDITDRNGVLLARNSFSSSDLYLSPKEMFSIDQDLAKLLIIFPDLESKMPKIRQQINNSLLTQEQKQLIFLVKPKVTLLQRQAVLDAGIVGVQFEEREKRVYPHRNVASHILGFVSVDGDGMAGIERWIDKNQEKHKVELSIEIGIQSIVQDILQKAKKDYDAKGAIGLIMNARTGEIIAAVSLPDFDPNHLRNANPTDLFNKFSIGSYELGSIFKIFLATMAMDENIPMTKKYNTLDPYQIDDKFEIKDFRFSRKQTEMTLLEIIKKSSNVGCARIVDDILDAQYKQKQLFEKLGLTERLQTEIQEAGYPILPKHWYKANVITASYGHGIAVTPLQFIAAASAIINNGIMVKPTFIKIGVNNPVKVEGRIVSARTSAQVRHLLREVVESGTGKKGAATKYDVGGKSGTAIQVGKKGYNYQKMIVSFFAGVPMSRPEYVFFIAIEEPAVTAKHRENMLTGGNIAAPIIGDIITLSGPMLGIDIKQ